MRIRDRRFPATVLFTDEATFLREGMYNSHNTPVWSEEDPHATRTCAAQRWFSVIVWSGIVGDHFVRRRCCSNIWQVQTIFFLQQVLSHLLDDAHVSVAMHSSIWFQHDGGHYRTDVRLHLNANYDQQWIGQCGLVHWSARSPDLTCLDYFLWGYVKTLVHETTVNSAEELMEKSGTLLVFSRTFDLPCAGDVRPASRLGVVISNSFFDDVSCLFLFLFLFFILFVYFLSLSFMSTLLHQENVSNHALLCDFPSPRYTYISTLQPLYWNTLYMRL